MLPDTDAAAFQFIGHSESDGYLHPSLRNTAPEPEHTSEVGWAVLYYSASCLILNRWYLSKE